MMYDQNENGNLDEKEPTAQTPSEPVSTPGEPEKQQPSGSRWSASNDRPQTPQPPPPRQGGEGRPSAPYSPPYGSAGGYPPRQGGYGYGPQQPPNQGYNPYQYSANSGWQPPPPPPPDKYEWKFEDYDRLDNKKEKKKRNRGMVVFTVSLLCVLSVGLISLAGYSIYSAAADDPEEEEVVQSSQEAGAAAQDSQLQIADKPEITESLPVGGKMTIPQVADAVLPSVVGVIKYDNEQYFEMSGYGSGIVMSEDGYIITNAHVVVEGTGFKVQMYDGEAYDAEMIGYDSMTDLAVLKVDATDLVPAQFGDSTEIRVGETVIAIGNPAGLELASSVTQGIVSAVNREVRITNESAYNMNYIQTDAAINPGNSGGALANEYAQVIGINSSKIVAEGYEGIGFAIPISTAKPIIDDIIANGRVTGRVMLGITCQTVDEIDARNYGIQMGLMINSIDESSDLNGEGVQRGDILTHIDGERVYNLSDVRLILDKHKPGDTVTLTLYRKIGTKEVTYDADTRLLESM